MHLFDRFLIFFITLTLLLCGVLAPTANAMREEGLPDRLNAILSGILRQVGEDVQASFEPQKSAPLLSFIESEKDPDTLYYPAELDNTTSAYYQFEMDSSLERLLGYAYNNAIPPQALSPSSLRTAFRIGGEKGENVCWQWQLPAGDTPQTVRFAEHEEITPDLTTGAYYGYDVDRTLILYRLNGRNIFLSLSRQRDVSEVGKKGIALGEDENWDFLYSGETGLSKKGLGWVRSYMYKSFSVTVFYETEGKEPRLLCGTFKWLNAGWAKINMVQRQHIYRGLDRYATDLRRIIENRQLPPHGQVAEGFTALKALSGEELRLYLADYLASLSGQYATNRTLSRDTFSDLLSEKNYAELLDIPQMLAIVELEYLKSLLGKPCKLPTLRSLTDPVSVTTQ